MNDDPQANGSFRIVAIGASAGGLEAISELLAALPADTGMAFLIVQHLDPHHGSMLSEILAKRTRMPVDEAFDGQKVEPNHVYIIAPNTSMTVAKRCLTLRPRAEGRHPPMPIDILFESLAKDAGPDAIGVILSGTGSDGALGMQAIKAGGGHTFVQDEATARFNSMARAALEIDAADLQLPPREIAHALARIGRHNASEKPAPAAPDADAPADGDESLRQIFRLLRSACQVDFSHYKRGTIDRRLERRMVMRQLGTVQEYLEQLRTDPVEVQALCRDFLINVTSFFRDPHSYDDLARVVWPHLTEGRTPKMPLRIWVPGCATGEEVYSLAISLLEHLGERAAGMRIQIFGTDVSEAAIDVARAAQYIENIARDVSPERLQRYFIKLNAHYQVSRQVRELCLFSRHDVTRDPPFSRLALLSCRNLMIYLGAQAQKRLLPIFHYALKPGGYLTLGPAESLGAASELFQVLDGVKSKIYLRRPTPVRLPMEPPERPRARTDPRAPEPPDEAPEPN
ncbi:MAG: chemotaxis protein CheB, partial [Burkholderiaceae bacterium]